MADRLQIAQPPATSASFDEGRPDATLWIDVWRKLRRDPRFILSAALILVFTLMAVWPRAFTSADPMSCDILRSAGAPSAKHWFGFDLLGCDYYARVIYGARTSMIVGLVVASASVGIALVLGSVAGYFGGIPDSVISRFADVWFSIPTILGAILLLTLIRGSGALQVSTVLILFGWPDLTRLVRSSVLIGKERGFVRAARALGASDAHLLRRHILPNGISPVIVYASYAVGAAIAGEAGLTFLGVGLRLPSISWGLQIAIAQARFQEHPHLLFFPALLLCLLVGAFVLLGETLRDALDPKAFGRG
jgi:oligopeptide transport system permease protein